MAILTNLDYLPGVQGELVFSGDSLTVGTGATIGNLISYTLLLLGGFRLSQRNATGGQDAAQIAVKQGSQPLYISIQNGVLAGSAETPITSISNQFLSTPATPTISYSTGTVNGINAIITRTVVSTVETYTIKGFNNTTAAIQNNSVFYPDSAFNNIKNTQIMWWGKNGTGGVPLLTLYDNAINYMESPKRVLILGVLLSLDQIVGTAAYTSTIALNNSLALNYPKSYIVMTPPTVAEMAQIVYTPTTQDNTDIANGVFPTGMRADNVHLNSFGYYIVALRVAKVLKSYGW
jgi:hypothetical protein